MRPPFCMFLWKAYKTQISTSTLYFHIKSTLLVYNEKNIMKTLMFIWIFLGINWVFVGNPTNIYLVYKYLKIVVEK